MKDQMKQDYKKETDITRREFIKSSTAAAIGGTLLFGAPPAIFSSDGNNTNSTVVLVRNKDVIDTNGTPRSQVVQEMLDQAVCALTGKADAVEGWKTFIKPSDIVGIKTNVWDPIATTTQVESALKKRVLSTGVSTKNIAVADRGILKMPIFKKATALINARPMRTHHWAGVGSLIKNYIMFVPDPANYHGDACASLGKIWGYPLVKGKTRLNVLVMLTPQFHGVGPHSFSPKYVWKYHGLLAGFDPVAVDTIGVQIIQAQRNIYFGEERPLNPLPKHIKLADTRYHLGNANPEKIKLVKIGYDKDLLV